MVTRTGWLGCALLLAACSSTPSTPSEVGDDDTGASVDDDTGVVGDDATADSDSSAPADSAPSSDAHDAFAGDANDSGNRADSVIDAFDAGPCDADPSDPYGCLRDGALKLFLYDQTKGQTVLGYDNARNQLFLATGMEASLHGGQIECIYTGQLVTPDGTLTPGGFNTEHTWPQSMGASVDPAKSDLNDIFPAAMAANSARANYPYSFVGCGASPPSGACSWGPVGGSELGIAVGSSQVAFEARVERRGDVARAHFYFSVRYQLPITAIEEPSLRQWSSDDPPDDLERSRNDAVERLQGKRNPFIDRPDLVDRISDF